MTPIVWKSGDRQTVEQERWIKTEPDGTKVTWTIEKVEIINPTEYQVKLDKFGARVIPAYVELVNTKTGKPSRHSYYWAFSQTFFGGAGSNKDPLGGFASGQYTECYDETAARNKENIQKLGFTKQG